MWADKIRQRKPVQFPHLTDCLRCMFIDNYGTQYRDCVLPEEVWQWPHNADTLEKQAANLSKLEKELLCNGDDVVQQKVCRKYRCDKLSEFLGNVFDGDLGSRFIRNLA